MVITDFSPDFFLEEGEGVIILLLHVFFSENKYHPAEFQYVLHAVAVQSHRIAMLSQYYSDYVLTNASTSNKGSLFLLFFFIILRESLYGVTNHTY